MKSIFHRYGLIFGEMRAQSTFDTSNLLSLLYLSQRIYLVHFFILVLQQPQCGNLKINLSKVGSFYACEHFDPKNFDQCWSQAKMFWALFESSKYRAKNFRSIFESSNINALQFLSRTSQSSSLQWLVHIPMSNSNSQIPKLVSIQVKPE